MLDGLADVYADDITRLRDELVQEFRSGARSWFDNTSINMESLQA
jgi:hypothetical protein